MEFFQMLFFGAIIGVANIIPGVSGGTMALVCGIYERLLGAIGSINLGTFLVSVKVLSLKPHARRKFMDEMKRIDFLFLFTIALGALAAIVLLANIMTICLNEFHDPTYGFFFGLVLVSVYSPYKLIKKRRLLNYLYMALAVCCVIFVAHSVLGGDKLIEKAMAKEFLSHGAAKSRLNNLYVLFLGGVSISAMILPGVSGSFLLLLLGGYFPLLMAISQHDYGFLAFFALGCLLGLLFFTRILNFLIIRYHDETMSFLVGLVLGSLWMIWPFKKIVLVNSTKVYLNNIWLHSLGPNEIFTIGTFLAGVIVVLLLLLIEKRNFR